MSTTNLLTIRQACAALNICRNTLLAMIADGRVRAVNLKRPGGKYDVWRVDVGSAGQDQTGLDRVKLHEIEKRMGL